MRLLVINPNTSSGMTAAIGRAAQQAAPAGCEILALHPPFGPLSIEGHAEEALAGAGVVAVLGDTAVPAHDAAVIACFGDPGLDAARELCQGPVLGIAEAAFHAATMVATGFSVVTTMTRTCIIAEHLVQRYGFGHQCRGVHGTDIPVLDLEHPAPEVVNTLADAARRALAQDRSEAIVLGCAGMAPLCGELQRQLGVPVIDGVAVAVRFAASLVALGLNTSRRGDYAAPLPKRYLGWCEGLSPSVQHSTPQGRG
jgi:allantoin racemase